MRPRGPNRAVDPITAAVLDALDATGLSLNYIEDKAGVSRQKLSAWRTGAGGARTETLGRVLDAIGLRVAIVDVNHRLKSEPIRLASFNTIRNSWMNRP